MSRVRFIVFGKEDGDYTGVPIPRVGERVRIEEGVFSVVEIKHDYRGDLDVPVVKVYLDYHYNPLP